MMKKDSPDRSNRIKAVCAAVLFGALSALLFSCLRAEGQIILGCLSLFWVILAAAKGRNSAAGTVVPSLFLISPFAPVFGTEVVLTGMLIAAALDSRSLKGIKAGLPFLSVLASWVALEIVTSADFELFRIISDGTYGANAPAGPAGFSFVLSSESIGFLQNLKMFSRYAAFFALFGILSRSPDTREKSLSAVLCGSVAGALVSAIQLNGYLPQLFKNQTFIWDSLGRKTGSFSDPNGFGLFAALILPLFLAGAQKSKAPAIYAAGALLWLAMGVLSGSRTFYLALIVYLAIYVWHKSRKGAACVAAAGALAVVLYNLAAQIFPQVREAFISYLPFGARRLEQTLYLPSWSEAIFSREVFARAAGHVWLENPLTGAGFGRFRNLIPEVSAKLELGTQFWFDNPNNFYLGILSETGLLGALTLLSVFIFLKKRSDCPRAWSAPFFAVIVLFVTGPHLEFDEVFPLVALSMGALFEITRERKHLILSFALSALAAGAVFLSASENTSGFYRWEADDKGAFRWFGKRAQEKVSCPDSGTFALNVDTSGAPSRVARGGVKVQVPGQVYQLKAGEKTINIPCEPGKELDISLSSKSVWMPELYGYKGDRRLLGFKLRGFAEFIE